LVVVGDGGVARQYELIWGMFMSTKLGWWIGFITLGSKKRGTTWIKNTNLLLFKGGMVGI
jgi:hypothetical protein